MAVTPPKPKKQAAGAPAWLATFADMMSLLLCFFVLLLTMSEVDAVKFKETSGSMKMAFGVQRDDQADEVPMGTSIVAQEYSPGQQQLMDFNILGEAFKGAGASNMSQREKILWEQDMSSAAATMINVLRKLFAQEIQNKELLISKTPEHHVVLRLPGEFIFEGQSSELKQTFAPSLIKLSMAAETYARHVAVLGHVKKGTGTPAQSAWDISSQRAVAIAETMIDVGESDPSKFLIMSHGDTRPVNPEETDKNLHTYSDRIELVLVPDPNR